MLYLRLALRPVFFFNLHYANDGGAVTGRTRKDIEEQTGKPVISSDNFKQLGARGQKMLNSGEE